MALYKSGIELWKPAGVPVIAANQRGDKVRFAHVSSFGLVFLEKDRHPLCPDSEIKKCEKKLIEIGPMFHPGEANVELLTRALNSADLNPYWPCCWVGNMPGFSKSNVLAIGSIGKNYLSVFFYHVAGLEDDEYRMRYSYIIIPAEEIRRAIDVLKKATLLKLGVEPILVEPTLENIVYSVTKISLDPQSSRPLFTGSLNEVERYFSTPGA